MDATAKVIEAEGLTNLIAQTLQEHEGVDFGSDTMDAQQRQYARAEACLSKLFKQPWKMRGPRPEMNTEMPER